VGCKSDDGAERNIPFNERGLESIVAKPPPRNPGVPSNPLSLHSL
jgi:hypothetical protein